MQSATDSPRAADTLLTRWFDKFALAATQPEMGTKRTELSPTARMLFEGSYLAIYQPEPYGIRIIAVVHGMRDPASWLD